jgi:DNA polymerase I-like protein with 3'-5' exonuclease and polymerase domains
MTNQFHLRLPKQLKRINFENQKLDYPKKIIYNHLSKDSLVTEILQSGKPSSEKYLMKKIK